MQTLNVGDVIDGGYVIIGGYQMDIKPTDTDLIESLRQRGYTVSFRDAPESGLPGPESVGLLPDRQGTGG